MTAALVGRFEDDGCEIDVKLLPKTFVLPDPADAMAVVLVTTRKRQHR